MTVPGVPQKLPRSPAERQRIIADAASVQNLRGGTREGRAKRQPARQQMNGGSLEVVQHGDDGTVERPPVAHVRWVGAATPDNAEPFDDWYSANV
jgi:hypothetical protein